MSRYLRVALVLIFSSIALVQSDGELRLVSVLFNNGDRAPDAEEIYPKDPYKNVDFSPTGLGGLTTDGKRRTFTMGLDLKAKYKDFLGDIYLADDVVARSTDSRRTKMSLLAVLSALYPPVKNQRWHPEMPWQPIPITSLPTSVDTLLAPEHCPRYIKELERVKSLPEVVEKVEQFRPLMNALAFHTGKSVNSTNDLRVLFNGLTAEGGIGRVRPSRWTIDFFPNGDLINGAGLHYDIASYSDELKKLNGGVLLKRILDDMTAKIKGGPVEAQKLNLFAGHEGNVAALLRTLGVGEKPNVPRYSSAVIFELQVYDKIPHVMVYHYLGIPRLFKAVTVPGCPHSVCTFEKFTEALANVTPTNEDLDCPRNLSLPQTA